MGIIQNYIIVDDDDFNNILSSITIEDTLGKVDIKAFSVPENGLAYIQNEYIKICNPTVLLLDLNMPTLTGWEFIEQYEKFPVEITSCISIYILSSSVDERDKDKAKGIRYIKGFISKPLESQTILSIAKE